MARTPVIPEATPVGALSAQLRRSCNGSFTSKPAGRGVGSTREFCGDPCFDAPAIFGSCDLRLKRLDRLVYPTFHIKDRSNGERSSEVYLRVPFMTPRDAPSWLI